LVGVAALEGRLNPDAPMGHPLWPSGQGFAQVTWRQWLQMTDGQDWTEVDARTILENGSAQALFGPGRLDVDRFCAQRPVRTRPGQSFRYNTCGITLAAGGLGRLIAPQQAPDQRRAALAAWMRERLFGPIGMASAVPEFDAQGTFLGGSLVYATAEDFALALHGVSLSHAASLPAPERQSASAPNLPNAAAARPAEASTRRKNSTNSRVKNRSRRCRSTR
jgi:CubicO group peptidase (beta-lactamase class C family)